LKNSVNENNELKDTLSLHYDNVSDNLNPNKLKTYGSNDINKYLKAPYKYIEDNFINNSDIYNKNILDYCCGTGSYSIMPAQNGANVWGVDISSKSIELAIKRSKILNTSKKCKFEVGDAEKLNFNDNFFDIILCYGSFSYLDLNKSFQELKRVLRPEGKIILVDSLGYNPLINYNRKRNITNYAPNYVNQLRTITHKDLKISLKYFDSYSIHYFDFFTLLGKLLSSKFKINIDANKLATIDSYFLKLPLVKRLSFKFVCVIS
jgi:ubiquinone/menaquinone biosynthesis C-methylase UbiE